MDNCLCSLLMKPRVSTSSLRIRQTHIKYSFIYNNGCKRIDLLFLTGDVISRSVVHWNLECQSILPTVQHYALGHHGSTPISGQIKHAFSSELLSLHIGGTFSIVYISVLKLQFTKTQYNLIFVINFWILFLNMNLYIVPEPLIFNIFNLNNLKNDLPFKFLGRV